MAKSKYDVFSTHDQSVFTDQRNVFSSDRHNVFIETSSAPKYDRINEQNYSGRGLKKEGVKIRSNDTDRFVSYSSSKKDGTKIEKYALKDIKVDEGGGANFAFKFDKNGKLKGNIKLEKGFVNNKDNDGIITKTGIVLNRAEKIVDLFSSDNNETEVGEYLEKEEKLLDYSFQASIGKRNRFDRIYKSAKKEERQLKKEVKAQAAVMSAKFVDKRESFTNRPLGKNNSLLPDYYSEAKDIDGYSFKNRKNIYDEKSLSAQVSFLGVNGHENGSETFLEKESKYDQFYGNNNEPKLQRFNNNNSSERILTNEEKLEQKQAQKKAAKKEKNKETRKAATYATVRTFIDGRKKLSNEVGNVDFQSSGDLLKDGSSGLISTFIDGGKQLAKSFGEELLKNAWRVVKKGLLFIFSLISTPLLFTLIFCLVFYGMFNLLFTPIASFLGDDTIVKISGTNETYEIDVVGDGTYSRALLSDEDIQEIIDKLYETYGNLNGLQESVLRYALSYIGCEYSQASHWDHTDNIFDCSEYAYLSYLAAGINIDNQGYYSAAEECRALINSGYEVSGDLKPGDLIFYGNANNGRYLGVYHVAIYLGNIDGVDKVVQAYNTKKGVIMSDVSTANIVSICRPI